MRARWRIGLALTVVLTAAGVTSGAPAHAAYTWEGTWSSTFGEIKMTASGSGTYPNCGTISGGLEGAEGRRNKGTWQECSSKGTYEFVMSGSGGSFDGTYAREGGGCVFPPCDWDGTCIAGPCTQNSAEEELPAKGERVTVASISGEVAYRLGGGKWRPLKQGDKLPRNAEIFTGVDSTVKMKLSDGSSFELNELTQILVDTIERSEDRLELKVQLKVGELEANVRKEKSIDTNFEVDNSWFHAGTRGTVFSVSYDAVARAGIVSTTRGSVFVDPVAGGLPAKIVSAGKEVEVTRKRISKLAPIGKAGARGGVNRERARTLVLARVDRAERGCNLTTRRSPSIVAVKPAPKGWLVRVTVGGEAKGKSKWSVKGAEARPKNRLARKINRRCS